MSVEKLSAERDKTTATRVSAHVFDDSASSAAGLRLVGSVVESWSSPEVDKGTSKRDKRVNTLQEDNMTQQSC